MLCCKDFTSLNMLLWVMLVLDFNESVNAQRSGMDFQKSGFQMTYGLLWLASATSFVAFPLKLTE